MLETDGMFGPQEYMLPSSRLCGRTRSDDRDLTPVGAYAKPFVRLGFSLRQTSGLISFFFPSYRGRSTSTVRCACDDVDVGVELCGKETGRCVWTALPFWLDTNRCVTV